MYSFWNEDIWLPPNVTWDTFDDDENFAQFSHLYFPIPAAFVLIAIRLVIERNIFRPLGIYLGLKHSENKHVTHAHDDEIQKAVLAGASDTHSIAKKTGVEERKVERWIRRNKKKMSTLGRYNIIFPYTYSLLVLQTNSVRLVGDGPSTFWLT